MNGYRRWADAKMDEVERRFAEPRSPDSPLARTPQPWPQPAPARRGTGRLVLGAGLVALAAVLWEAPGIFAPISMAQAHAVCNSSLGVLAESLSKDAQRGCGNVSENTAVIAVLALAGAALVAWGWVKRRATR